MSDHQGGYNPPAGYQPQGGYPQQQAGYGTPQGGYPQQQQGGWGQPPGYGQQQQPSYGAPQQRSSGSPRFDLESIKPGGLIAIVSGVLLFVISFFHWYVANVGAICDQLGPLGREACIAQASASGGGLANAWARGITKFALILALLIVIAFVLKAMKVLPANIPVELVAAGILVIADICFLITFISKGVPSEFASIVKRGWPLYVGLLLVLALNAGVIMALLNAGGLSTIKGGIAKIQTAQATSTNTGYGQQQWGQQQQPQQWGQQPPQQPQQQWGQAPGAQPGAQQGWPSGSQQYQSGQQPQVGPPSGGHPAQPSWGQQPEQPQQGGWPRQEPAQPSWGQPEQPPQQGGWPQQRPEEQQQQWPQQPPQPPQQGGWQ